LQGADPANSVPGFMLLEPVDPNESFRARRRQARRSRARRRISALALVALAAAGVTLGARFLTESDTRPLVTAPAGAGGAAQPAPEPKPEPRPYPDEMRGVHVTMALASLKGKLNEYLSLTSEGLNTLELDVKDENGEVAFSRPRVELARQIGAARTYYDPFQVVRKVREKGVYLIGRVVVFEDPLLAERKPGMAIRRSDGGIWRNHAGLGWANPYDKRVWRYNVAVAVAAATAGFDEIQFDYVRFPTDGDVGSAVFAGKRRESKARTISAFLAYAREHLEPLGVRISADVFGLAATRNMGIGQSISRLARHLDAVYPMVYPSHYGPGQFNLPDPNAQPGRTVALSLRDFASELRGLDTRLVPWLQDFSLGREYTIDDVREQIQAARDASVEGYLLWNPAGVYTPGGLVPR
jgi:hypothetical protein